MLKNKHSEYPVGIYVLFGGFETWLPVCMLFHLLIVKHYLSYQASTISCFASGVWVWMSLDYCTARWIIGLWFEQISASQFWLVNDVFISFKLFIWIIHWLWGWVCYTHMLTEAEIRNTDLKLCLTHPEEVVAASELWNYFW